MSTWILLLTSCLAVALAAPIEQTEGWSGLQTNGQSGRSGRQFQMERDGRYVMRYETPAGVTHFETGYLRRLPDGTPYQVKEGYYIYPTADGRRVHLSYFADHQGFRVIDFQIRSELFENELINRWPLSL